MISHGFGDRRFLCDTQNLPHAVSRLSASRHKHEFEYRERSTGISHVATRRAAKIRVVG